MSANADLQPEDERPPEDVQGSKMSANADLALQATCPDLDVQGPKMSAKADEISRDQKQLSDIFA